MNAKRILGLVALAGFLLVAGPTQRAGAVSLLNPAVAAAVQQDETVKTVTEARWRHYRRHYGFHRHYYRRHYYGYRHYGYRHQWRRHYYRFF